MGNLENGLITDIVWQNDCYTCPNTVNCVINNQTSLWGNTSLINSDSVNK